MKWTRCSFTFVEVLVGLLLMAIGLFPLASNFFESYRQTKKIYLRNEALEKITERMNALLNLDFEENFQFEVGGAADAIEYTETTGKTDSMKEILKSAPSTQYDGVKYDFILKLKAVPQTYLGMGITGGKIVEEVKNFVQITLILNYKDTANQNKTMTLCSRLGQRSL